jgi:hypothetical protein
MDALPRNTPSPSKGEDFTVQKFMNGRATAIDYHLTLDMTRSFYSFLSKTHDSKDFCSFLSESRGWQGVFAGIGEKV